MALPTAGELRAELERMEALKAYYQEQGLTDEAARRYQRLQRALAAMEQGNDCPANDKPAAEGRAS